MATISSPMAPGIEPTVKDEPNVAEATDSDQELADSTVAVVSESETERDVQHEVEPKHVNVPARLEQKYRHPMLDKSRVVSPKHTSASKAKKTREETIDDAITRALAAYCHMRKHETDYYPAEIEQIYDVTVQLLVSKILLVHEKKDQAVDGELVQESAKKYPYIYYELSELREAQHRRLQFFEGHKDLVAIAEINDFVDEMNEKFAEAIEEVTVQLEELIHYPSNQRKPKKKPTAAKSKLRLTDVVADVQHKRKSHRRHH